MQALLALEDGRTFRGKSFGAQRGGSGRGGVQHLPDGLPGDLYRSIVRRDRLWF